eukprot:5672602-Lingulodinium_polyedra.AAC.1
MQYNPSPLLWLGAMDHQWHNNAAPLPKGGGNPMDLSSLPCHGPPRAQQCCPPPKGGGNAMGP